ncbi:OadG family protein [Fusibacter bizertensis]|uniref:OadG family protein n=1 Tax=Fusibacter bizertensis TaxID=1488331 RepID=A0ABT6NGW7_9FIRM|nr:OadG family protein [Fusibacter bizertensis]MDH8679659.1 OadG family protein [Fusibacter bizertensis]
MHVLESFKHADTFSQMPMGDKMLATGYVILLGMGITVVALVLIWIVTVLMSFIIRKMEKSQEIRKVPNAPKPAVASTVEAPALQVKQEDDEELIAVISAAIAATLNTSMQNIKVTNIRRISDNTPTWGKVGRNDVMNARL